MRIGKLAVNKTHTNRVVAKAREYKRNQSLVEAKVVGSVTADLAVKTVAEVMNTKDACVYLDVSKTTLRGYEKAGWVKAIRNIRPEKTRGKVTWSRAMLDRIKFGVSAQN